MMKFFTDCGRCPRLAGFFDEVRDAHSDYCAMPVPSFHVNAVRDA